MTIDGHVENGNIVLDEAVPLNDGMKVRLELLASSAQDLAEEVQIPTRNERYKSIIGIDKNLPADFAGNRDQYIHGQPKR